MQRPELRTRLLPPARIRTRLGNRTARVHPNLDSDVIGAQPLAGNADRPRHDVISPRRFAAVRPAAMPTMRHSFVSESTRRRLLAGARVLLVWRLSRPSPYE